MSTPGKINNPFMTCNTNSSISQGNPFINCSKSTECNSLKPRVKGPVAFKSINNDSLGMNLIKEKFDNHYSKINNNVSPKICSNQITKPMTLFDGTLVTNSVDKN